MNQTFHNLAGAAGADLRYLRTGTGRPLVLLHTLRTQLEYFRPLIVRLDTTRVEVVVVDLPGHGRSTAPRIDYTADYFTDCVEQVLERCDLREAILAGDSIGGTVALTLAARGNPRVAYVIAVNPYDYGRWSGIGAARRSPTSSSPRCSGPGSGPSSRARGPRGCCVR